ncbi:MULTISPECIES: MarR family transcriptional regulator [Actinoalloteichus]|uniref:Transcriptional regulator n=1 Tax=Actinoalloteichus fjordicus TaxID=1612552 RepID=A0AAC9L8K0_9PSEU|nr:MULTISPECIES: MarR family transcriptional regulator [Actinoalloteichus]APU13153.1 transcriptional regulator [Actinoalloteichus fjordicus]APU19103.1 transcriptional regulator [Actinoalloteichus sp. GBA129-24]
MSELGVFSESTGFLLHRLGIGADRVIEETLRPYDVRARELRVLALLGTESRSQAELVGLSGLDRTTMVAVVDRLEERQLVARRRNPSDRRRLAVSATEAGAGLLAAAARDLRAAEADFLEPLSPTQQQQLTTLLGALFAARAPRC